MKRIPGLALLALLAACGGGGGGGGGGDGPTPAPTGISEAYYPVGTGMRWIYQVEDSDSGAPSRVETVITGTRPTPSGVSAWVFSESDPATGEVFGENWYSKDARAYVYVGSSGSAAADLISIVAPFDMMRFDGSFSQTPLVLRNDVDIGADLDGDGISDRADVRIDGVVEGTETLQTELGSFSNTARLRYDAAGSIKLSRGASVPFTQTVRAWHAPQIGSVRQWLELRVADEISTQTMEATGFSVNNVLGGVVPLHDVLSGLAAASSDPMQPGHPAIATDGQRYFVVTRRMGTTGSQWIGRFVAADGSMQETVEISPPADNWGTPAVAWNGSSYLVVTGGAAAFGMRAQRISPAGVVLDAYPGTELAADAVGPQLAGGAGAWLAVYRRTGAPDSLFGMVISASGLPGPEFLIATGVADLAQPAVAFDGTNYLVAWEAGPALDPARIDLYARRVGPTGTLLESDPFVVSSAAEAQLRPRIACDPGNCLIAWTDRRHYPGQPYNFTPAPGDMYGAFVTRSGAVLNGTGASGGLLFATVAANAGDPGLSFDGTTYVLGWSQGAFANSTGEPTGIFGLRIGTDGATSPAAPGLAVSGPPAFAVRHVAPALASVQGRTLAVWLANTELSGTSKSVKGAIVASKLTR